MLIQFILTDRHVRANIKLEYGVSICSRAGNYKIVHFLKKT